MTIVKAAVVPASKVVKVSKREKFLFMVLVICSWVAGVCGERAVFAVSFISDLTKRRSALFFTDNFTRFFVPRFPARLRRTRHCLKVGYALRTFLSSK